MKTYNSVAQMKLSFLTAGQEISTVGFITPGDGGRAPYLIEASQAVDGFGDHELADSTVAILQPINGVITTRTYGTVSDGVADDSPQINAAITAANAAGGGTVILSPSITSYRIGTPIIAKDNVTLEGSGWNSVLEALDALGNNAVIDAISVNNFQVRNLKIDGNGNVATNPAYSGESFGINISGTSSNCSVENVWIFDAYYIGIDINGGTDITLSNIKVSTGCLSNGILIGPYNVYPNEADVRNINVNNILVQDVQADGIGTWAPGASVCEIVNYNNIIIKNNGQGTGLTGQSFWLSTNAERVSLSNFTIENNGLTHGIHLEECRSLVVTNGSIKDDGNAVGYGINVTGAVSDSHFSNITIDGWVVRGLLTNNNVVDCTFSDIRIKGSAHGASIDGVRNKFTNLQISDETFGTGNSGLSIIGTSEEISLQGIHVRANGVATGIGINLANTQSVVSVEVHGCRVLGNFGTPIICTAYENNEIRGEQVSVRLMETVAAGDDYELTVLGGTFNVGMLIVGIYMSFDTTIPQSDTDYNSYTLRRRDSAGSNPLQISLITTTQVTGGKAFNAFANVEFGIFDSNFARILPGENVTLEKIATGAGQAESNGLLILEYVTF